MLAATTPVPATDRPATRSPSATFRRSSAASHWHTGHMQHAYIPHSFSSLSTNKQINKPHRTDHMDASFHWVSFLETGTYQHQISKSFEHLCIFSSALRTSSDLEIHCHAPASSLIRAEAIIPIRLPFLPVLRTKLLAPYKDHATPLYGAPAHIQATHNPLPPATPRHAYA